MLSENLATYLASNGQGTLGSSIFLGSMPDTSSNAILLEDTGGLEPNRYITIKKNTVQVTIRNKSYRTGITKANAIYDLLHQSYDQTNIGGEDVMLIEALSEPNYLGKDESGRYLFSVNFLIQWRNA